MKISRQRENQIRLALGLVVPTAIGVLIFVLVPFESENTGAFAAILTTTIVARLAAITGF